jgi:hypothetical protein
MANDEVMGMTVAMIDSINGIISRRNKQTHQQMGEDILGNMNWN